MKLLMMFFLLHTTIVIQAAPIGSDTARRASIAESSVIVTQGTYPDSSSMGNFLSFSSKMLESGSTAAGSVTSSESALLNSLCNSNQFIIQYLRLQIIRHRRNLSESIYGWDNPIDFFCGNSTYHCQRAYLFCGQMCKKVRAQELWILGKTFLFTSQTLYTHRVV